MADYPASLPIAFPVREKPQNYQVLRSEVDEGQVDVRLKSPLAPKAYSFEHQSLTPSEVATWVTFWEGRKGGALAFNFTDPRTGTVKVVRFDMEKPEILLVGPSLSNVRVSLKEML